MYRVYIVLLTFFLVGLVLVSGLYIASYLIGRGLAPETVPTPVLSVQDAALEESGQARLGSLSSLVHQPAECVLIGNELFTEGTAFIADNELRVDLIDMTNHLIQLVATSTGERLIPEGQYTTTNILDISIGYRCKAWQPDMSVFVLTL